MNIKPGNSALEPYQDRDEASKLTATAKQLEEITHNFRYHRRESGLTPSLTAPILATDGLVTTLAEKESAGGIISGYRAHVAFFGIWDLARQERELFELATYIRVRSNLSNSPDQSKLLSAMFEANLQNTVQEQGGIAYTRPIGQFLEGEEAKEAFTNFYRDRFEASHSSMSAICDEQGIDFNTLLLQMPVRVFYNLQS